MRCYPSINEVLNELLGTHYSTAPPFTFGICALIGILIGAIIGYKEIEQRYKLGLLQATVNKSGEAITPQGRWIQLLAIAMVGAIFGSKILDINSINGLLEFISNPIDNGGKNLTLFWGLIGGMIPMIFYFRYYKLSVGYFLDAFCPAFFIGSMIGRIGCHVAGDGCWGIESNINNCPSFIPVWLWGFNYPHNIINNGIQIANCTETHCNMLPNTVFPTPIYEVILTGICCFCFYKMKNKLIKIEYALFGLALILQGMERFSIEYIRVNEKLDWFGLNWTKYQWVSIVFILLGVSISFITHRKKSKTYQ